MTNDNSLFSFNHIQKIVHEETYAIVESISSQQENLPDRILDQISDSFKYLLKELGLLYLQIKGSYQGCTTNHSFFIVKPIDMKLEKFREIIFNLGVIFRQESVVISTQGNVELVFTTGKYAGKACLGRGFIHRSNNNGQKASCDNYSEIKTSDGKNYYIGEFDLNRKRYVNWKA